VVAEIDSAEAGTGEIALVVFYAPKQYVLQWSWIVMGNLIINTVTLARTSPVLAPVQFTRTPA
jgi:hypothetical protein